MFPPFCAERNWHLSKRRYFEYGIPNAISLQPSFWRIRIERLALHRSLANEVYQRLLDAICDGEFEPGRRLTQDELASQLAVSRQPVLQALSLLKAQGFVTESGRRGVAVAPLDPVFIVHLYELRSIIDGAAARAASRHVDKAAANRGSQLIENGRRAVGSDSVANMITADMAFHRFLHELSGNPLISEAASVHRQHVRRVMGGYLRQAPLRHSVWDEHSAVLDAVIAGDGTLAENLARHHVEAALDNLLLVLNLAESTDLDRRMS
jgi:DNA-binding GntR family transcriptional regulator